MDCNHVRLLLLFSQKKMELDVTEAEALQAHLEQCGECELLSRSEGSMDDVLGRAMKDVPAPAGLQARLLARLEGERRDRFVRTGGMIAVAAAVLLVAAGFGWHFVFGKPEVTPEGLQAWLTTLDLDTAEINHNLAKAPETVEGWFASHHIAMEAPRDFDYAYLKSVQTAPCLKSQVPKLVFVRTDRGVMAEVYVLSESQFQLTPLREELKKGFRLSPSSFSAHLSQSPAGFIFLVIFQGGPLELLKIERPDA